MAKRKPVRRKTKATKRQRYRSNVYHPKVKRPITFELTKEGTKLLDETMARCQKSIGDIYEQYLRTVKLTSADFPAAAPAGD